MSTYTPSPAHIEAVQRLLPLQEGLPPAGQAEELLRAVAAADGDVYAALWQAMSRVEQITYDPGHNCREVWAFLGLPWDSGIHSHEAWRLDDLGGRGKPCEVACKDAPVTIPPGLEVLPGQVIRRLPGGELEVLDADPSPH